MKGVYNQQGRRSGGYKRPVFNVPAIKVSNNPEAIGILCMNGYCDKCALVRTAKDCGHDCHVLKEDKQEKSDVV
jgi:hypothetical protein